MGTHLTAEVLCLRALRYLGQWRNRITERLAQPKIIALIVLGGYSVRSVVWLVQQVGIRAQATHAVSPTPPTKRFIDDTGLFFVAWGVAGSLLMFLASQYKKKHDSVLRLRHMQKERIRLLDNFEPTPRMVAFFDNRSIYNAIIAMLDRLSQQPNKGDQRRHHEVCMLLCSPALDYWNNPNSFCPNTKEFEWGLEFQACVSTLAANGTVWFDVCHLPRSSASGSNAMRDFIGVLANYIIQTERRYQSHSPEEEDDQFQRVFDLLWGRADKIASDFAGWARHKDTRHRFAVRTHTMNIPFQIVLVDGEDCTEVVVSFAGREVLEREQKAGVRGFFSSDPYVVKAFHQVFKTYVEARGRIPYIPPHTRGVAGEHDRVEKYVIPGFGYDLVDSLRVTSDVFSPVVGNSSKFTVWVLEKLLTTGDRGNAEHWPKRIRKVLDVGAGTGVLSLAVGGILRKRCKREDYKVVAIECCVKAAVVLRENCACDENIEVRGLTLCRAADEYGQLTSAWFEAVDGERVELAGELSAFDLIVGDLPFVHARERVEKDRRFLDLDHQLHQSLMWMCSNSKILAKGGVLVTAFSNLGGPDDVSAFEKHIGDNGLQVIQRVDFFESGYMWMVYVLMKRSDYENYGDRLWWKMLDAERREVWPAAEAK